MRKTTLLTMIALFIALSVSASAQFIDVNFVSQDPDPAVAGDVVELRFGVENTGTIPAESVILELVPEYPIEILPGEDETRNIGTLKAYQIGNDMKIVKFRVRIDRDVVQGDYPIKVFAYQEGEREVGRIQRTANLSVKYRENAEAIYIDKMELVPGVITPVKFTITNVGSAPLRDISFKWENEDGVILPVGTSDTKYVQRIEVDESAELVYDVMASASAVPNLYKLKMTLSYDDSVTGETTSTEALAGMYVGGSTDFDIAYAGTANGETSFSVSNIGSVQASSVTVRVPSQPSWRATGTDAVIIGNLNTGDYTIVSFALQQSGGLARVPMQSMQQGGQQGGFSRNTTRNQSVPLALEVAFTDTRGNRHVSTKEVMLNADSMGNQTSLYGARMRPGTASTTTGLSTTHYVLIGVAALVLIVFYRRYAKRRRDDPDYSFAKMVREVVPSRHRKK